MEGKIKMTTSEVENKIKKAAENATPNIKDAVIQKCKNESFSNVVCFQYKKNREILYAVLATVAMLIIVAKIVFGLVDDSIMKRITTTVDIDVNPSLELQINKYDKVVEAVALNDDAIIILDGMDLHGVQTKIAVNAIVGSMFEHGYLTGDTNTVLISVDGKDKQQANNTKANITADVDSLLKAYNPNAYVISQDITEGTEIEAMIDTYHISSGKASLIKKILDNTDKYTIDELVELNITELNNIIKSIDSIAVIDNQVLVINNSDKNIDASINASDNLIEENDKYTNINDIESPSYMENGGKDDLLKDKDTISNNSNSKKDKNNKSVSNNELNKKSKNVDNKDDKNKDNTNKNNKKKNKSSNNDKSKKNKQSSDGVNTSDSVSDNDVSNNDVSNNDVNGVSENDVAINDISVNDVSVNGI